MQPRENQNKNINHFDPRQNKDQAFWLVSSTTEDDLTTHLIDLIYSEGLDKCIFKMVAKRRKDLLMKVLEHLKSFFPEKEFKIYQEQVIIEKLQQKDQEVLTLTVSLQ